MARGETQLYDPLFRKLERAIDPSVGKRIDGIEQGVRHVVVVGSQLRLNTRHGEEASHTNVQPLLDRKIQVNVFEDRIESILAIEFEELLAKIVFGCREPIVRAVEGGKVIAEIEVILLHRIGQTLHVNNSLV